MFSANPDLRGYGHAEFGPEPLRPGQQPHGPFEIRTGAGEAIEAVAHPASEAQLLPDRERFPKEVRRFLPLGSVSDPADLR